MLSGGRVLSGELRPAVGACPQLTTAVPRRVFTKLQRLTDCLLLQRPINMQLPSITLSVQHGLPRPSPFPQLHFALVP